MPDFAGAASHWRAPKPPSGGLQPAAAAPTFSVVIAAYQSVGSVRAAVASALDQTVPPIEVVVCDDGSTDGTGDAIRGLEPRVRVVRQDNRGEAAAKNAAAARATGDYLVILDADDLFAPTRLEAIGALAAARPDLDVITTDAWLLDVVSGNRRRCYGPGFRFETEDQPEEILRRNFVLGLAAVRRAAFEAVGGFDPAIAVTTDWHLWIRMIHAGSRVGLIEQPLATYRIHAGSLSADPGRVLEGRIATLTDVRLRLALQPEHRRMLERTLREQRQLIARHRLRQSLAARAPDVRRRAMGVVFGPGQPVRSRLKAIAALAVPDRAAARAAVGDEAARAGFRPTAAGGGGQPPAAAR
jgi:GT2 family glycosyltransferase